MNKRLLSIDVLRGMTLIFMIIVNTPGSWSHVYAPLLHADWNGLTPTDYIFPNFLFIVGVSIVLSLNNRKSDFNKNQVMKKIIWRALKIYLVGVFLWVFPDFDFENQYTQAVAFGLASALAYALRNILMKKQVAKYHGSLLMMYQALIIGVLLIPLSFQTSMEALQDNLMWILALALLTTALGHTLFLLTFRYFSITTASIISSVQPVYGIALGILFLGEVPQWATLVGGLLIISAVIIESLRSAKRKS